MIRSCSLLLAFAFTLSAEPVDWIWHARWVVTMDAQRRVIDHGAVAIRGQRIVAVGTQAAIDRDYQPKQRLNIDGVLTPGFINTHTHAAMSLFRGIADDLRLQDWLQNYIFPAEARNVTRDFVRWGTRLACLEMALSGTTTYTDMYYFEEVVAEVTKDAGLRGVLGQTIIGFPVADYKTPQLALAGTEDFLRRFQNDSLITPAPAPHALYTNSDESLKAARALANKYKVPLIMHIDETKKEHDDALAARKMSPVKVLDSLGVFNGRTVAAHAVWVDDADIQILKSKGVGIAHNPSSNMKLASGVAPILKFFANQINVGLGTDGVAGSNNDHDLMEEMDLAAKLQKVTSMDPRSVNAFQALEMATIGGARVLGLESQIGSIEPGKRADLVAISTTQPHAAPLYNIYSQIVYALKASDVRDVMVNGQVIVRDRKMLTLDTAAVLKKAAEYREQIQASLSKTEARP